METKPLTAEEIAEIAELDAKRTPGEWRWRGWKTGNDLRLESQASMRPIVMDFERWGMQGAIPRFRNAEKDIMERAPLLPESGRYRDSISDIDHPDARFIAACSTALPRLLTTIAAKDAENERLRAALEQVQFGCKFGDWTGFCPACHRQQSKGHLNECPVGNALKGPTDGA